MHRRWSGTLTTPSWRTATELLSSIHCMHEPHVQHLAVSCTWTGSNDLALHASSVWTV